MKNAIIIPCYNEADRLKFDAFQKFISEHKSFHFCFVNDGSADSTLTQLEAFAAYNTDQVSVVDLASNQGKAEAVRQGVLSMTQKVGIDKVGFIDADLATGFEDYLRLVDCLNSETKKMVIGSRKTKDCKSVERSAFRRMASRAIGTVITKLIDMPVCDTQCGAKVFDKATAAYLFSTPFVSKWLFDVELFLRLKSLYGNRATDVLSEVGLNNWTEVEGSKISLSASLKFPLRLLEIAVDYRVKPWIAESRAALVLGLALSRNELSN